MGKTLGYFVILFSFTTVFAKVPEPELPPCPTNLQFLPQNLPMHCKMTSQPYPAPGAMPPQFASFMPGSPLSPAVPGQPKTMPAPFPPQMPMGMGSPLPMGPMPMGPMPMGPMPMGIPGMPMGMPMPMPPQAKLPVIVMPFYSPDPAYKDPRKDPKSSPEPYKRKIRIIKKSRHHHDRDTDRSSDTDTSNSDTDSNDSDSKYWNWKNRRSMRRHKKIRHPKKQDYLTPMLQYVSKDGYVIFEKQISKGEAKDWLGMDKPPNGGRGNMDNANNRRENGEEMQPNKGVSPGQRTEESVKQVVNSRRRQRKPRPQTQPDQNK